MLFDEELGYHVVEEDRAKICRHQETQKELLSHSLFYQIP